MIDLLWAAAVVLIILWALGFATHFTLGGFIHVLLVLALVSIVARLLLGRRSA